MLTITNEDCMELMARYPDGYFDLAIVDPPYGIGISNNPVRQKHEKKQWDNCIPNARYFESINQVSAEQIIWGANYFTNLLQPSQGFIIWDKKQPEDFSLAMCEYAYCSFQMPAKIFRYSVLTERDKIHPTQKPVALYKWLLEKYAKPIQDKLDRPMRILDTHLGSGSIAIACHDYGYDLTACELDPDYYNAAMKRIAQHTSQLKLI